MTTNTFLNQHSLALTLDAVSGAFFQQQTIPPAQREVVAHWLATRQGQPGAYRDLVAPTPQDYQGIQLFTGERVHTHAAIGHILGEEACRTLMLLNVPHPEVQQAMTRAYHIVAGFGEEIHHRGVFCCGKCTVAMWRNLSVSPIPDAEKRLDYGAHYLHTMRDGHGRWRIFPFYYTLLALSEIDLPAARAELSYAAPTCQKLLSHTPATTEPYATRRRAILERVLEKC